MERLLPLSICGVSALIRAGLITSGFGIEKRRRLCRRRFSAVTFLFRRFRCSPSGAASTPLTRFLLVASPTRALNFFSENPKKLLIPGTAAI